MRTDFNEIVEKYSEPLYWYLRRMVVDHYDAEDLLQNVLVKAYRKLWQLRDTSSLRSWLFRIATNEANTFLKHHYHPDSLGEELAERLMASEFVDYTKEAEIKLQKAMFTLSPLEREVFSLKYYDDMDYVEISGITGSSVDSLKVSYHNAKEKIKKVLLNNI